MSDKIPTAEEFMLSKIPFGVINLKPSGPKIGYQTEKSVIISLMIEYTKLHRKAILEDIANKKTHGMLVVPLFNEEQINVIFNTYPENLIK